MKGLYAWVGFNTQALPYQPAARAHGHSKFRPLRLAQLALDGLTAFTHWPLRAVSTCGILLAVPALLYGLYLTLMYLLYGHNVSGWTTIVVSLMLFCGLQLMSLGIVGEYVGRIFEEVKGRPLYLVCEGTVGPGAGGCRACAGQRRSVAAGPLMSTVMKTPALSRRELAWVAVAALLWLAWSAGLRPLELPDEGRYVGVAWEGLRSGQWLVPLLNGEPFFHKPPLFYWITEASLSLFGSSALAARTAPLLGGWMAAVSLWWLLRRWSGPALARVALLVLLAMPLTLLGSQYANLDMLVAGCVSATVCLAADALLRRQQGLPWRRVLVAAHAVAGLGVLAKA